MNFRCVFRRDPERCYTSFDPRFTRISTALRMTRRGVKNIKFYCFHPSQSAPLTALPRGEPIDASPLAVVGKSNQSLPAGGGGNPSEQNVSEAVDGRGRVHIEVLFHQEYKIHCCAYSFSRLRRQRLAAARSRYGSDSPPDYHSLP